MSEQPPQPPGPPQRPDGEPATPPPPPPSTPTPPTPPPGGPGPAAPPPPPGGGYGAPPPAGEYGPPPGQQFQGQQYGAPGYGPPAQLSQQDERTWGMLAHISALLGLIVGLSFLGPLVVMLIQGQKSQFVRRQAVESLNFQITTYIAAFVSFILVFVLIGFLLLIIVGIGWLVLTIVAGMAANRGEDYRYPVNIRLVK